jgi:hypothetical protein
MHLFGVLGTLFFFFGFVILIYMAYAKLILGEAGMASRPLFYLGILTVIVGTQLFLTGFLGELIARNSNERNLYNIKETLGLS